VSKCVSLLEVEKDREAEVKSAGEARKRERVEVGKKKR
jgi:hypothetical protein